MVSDGTDLTDADVVAPCCGFGLSFFRALELRCNSWPMHTSNYDFMHYKNYLQTLLSYDNAMDNTLLYQNVMWLLADNADEMADSNSSFKKRRDFIKDSKEFELLIPVSGCDFLEAVEYLTPGHFLQFRFLRASNEFLLDSTVANKSYKVQLLEAKLCYTGMRVKQDLTRQIVGKSQMYHIPYTTVHRFSIAQGITRERYTLHNGRSMGKFYCIGFLPNDAVDGSFGHDPYQFKRKDLCKAQLFVNSVLVPGTTYSFDQTTNRVRDKQSWQLIYENLGGALGNNGLRKLMFKKDQFYEDCFILPFLLTPDKCSGLSCQHWAWDGLLELYVEFSTATTAAFTMLVLSANDAVVTMEANGQFETIVY